MSEPEPSSAMIGSEVSQDASPVAWTHATLEHKHVLSAIMTPAAPDRWAFRTYSGSNDGEYMNQQKMGA